MYCPYAHAEQVCKLHHNMPQHDSPLPRGAVPGEKHTPDVLSIGLRPRGETAACLYRSSGSKHAAEKASHKLRKQTVYFMFINSNNPKIQTCEGTIVLLPTVRMSFSLHRRLPRLLKRDRKTS